MNEIIKTILHTIILGIGMTFFALGVDHLLYGDLYNGTVITIVGICVGALAVYLIEQQIVQAVMKKA